MGGDRIGELGSGRLVDELAVGRPLRIEVEWGPALVTSPVRSLQHIGQSLVQVDTLNSIYRLEKTAASETTSSAAQGRSEVAEQGTSEAAAQGAPEASPPEPAVGVGEEASDDATGYVALTELAEPEDAVFAPGTRVRILRRKSAGPSGESFEVVGSGQVLDLLETGASARLAVENGPSFVTSPLQKIRLLDLHLIEFETKNSVYRLERLVRRAPTQD
jgi:hypothetical protein